MFRFINQSPQRLVEFPCLRIKTSRAGDSTICHLMLFEMADNLSILYVLFLSGKFFLCTVQAIEFKVSWNVPSQRCINNGVKLEALLKSYGIVVNEGDSFQGNKITIFYDTQLGYYPSVNKEGIEKNGGIPQLADLNAHLNKSAQDIEKFIPQKNWEGLGVIDWEDWLPVWEFNFGDKRRYQERARREVRDAHPDLPKEEIEKLAVKQWEEAAKTWMLETLGLARQMRPKGRWGFYQFPECYNHVGNSPKEFLCAEGARKGNDKLKWLWDASTATFPSLYLFDSSLGRYTFEQRTWITNGLLNETFRDSAPQATIYPYIVYDLAPGKMVPTDDFWRILSQIASSGSDGAVIWGAWASLATKDLCEQLRDYIVQVLGPAVKKISGNAEQCASAVCHARGRCTWLQDPNVTAWKIMQKEFDHTFYAGNITCRCTTGSEGKYCEIPSI